MDLDFVDWADEVFIDSLKNFESQKKVELQETGYEIRYGDDDSIGEIAFSVFGLVRSELPVQVCGWFMHDARDDGEDVIQCFLAMVEQNKNKNLFGENRAIMADYDIQSKEWGELYISSL